MKINLGTIEISKEDWDLISIYFTRQEAKENMREWAVCNLRNDALMAEQSEELVEKELRRSHCHTRGR